MTECRVHLRSSDGSLRARRGPARLRNINIHRRPSAETRNVDIFDISSACRHFMRLAIFNSRNDIQWNSANADRNAQNEARRGSGEANCCSLFLRIGPTLECRTYFRCGCGLSADAVLLNSLLFSLFRVRQMHFNSSENGSSHGLIELVTSSPASPRSLLSAAPVLAVMRAAAVLFSFGRQWLGANSAFTMFLCTR